MTSEALYTRNATTDGDIAGHLPLLLELGNKANIIVEFGVRGGCSTSAWLHAKPLQLWCYDIAVPVTLELFQDIAKQNKIEFHFERCDTKEVDHPECDILFLDTLHNEAQLVGELRNHKKVHQRIIFHDTETNGWNGEDNGGGLKRALIEFLLYNPEWRVESHSKENNGLTVLVRAAYAAVEWERA